MDNLNHWAPDLHPRGLSQSDLLECPFSQLEAWLLAAMDAEVAYPLCMVLATIGENGRPDQRLVLLKHIGPEGLATRYLVSPSEPMPDEPADWN